MDKNTITIKVAKPTKDELEEIIKPLIPTPIKGDKGDDGKAYKLTKKDKEEIAKSIDVPVVEKIIERIEAPSVTEIVREVEKQIPLNIDDIIAAIEARKGDEKLDAFKLDNIQEAVRRYAPKPLKGNTTNKYYGKSGDDTTAIEDSYSYIGYGSNEKIYTYDISALTYPTECFIVIDGNYEYVGISDDASELLAHLNTLNLGTFTINGTTISVVGFHTYGKLLPSVEAPEAPTLSFLSVDTTDPVTMPNIYGSSASDISLEASMSSNPDLQADVVNLNYSFWSFPAGAVIHWLHYVTPAGDQWNGLQADVEARGKVWEEIQEGDMYNGGVPYGREFFDEFKDMVALMPNIKVALAVNASLPLIPYSNALIDWDAVDIGALCDELDIAVAVMEAIGKDVWLWEIGMEEVTNINNDLWTNPGGAETGEDVFAKLLTHTNSTHPVSILEHLRAVTPNALLSVDATIWDLYPGNYPDWVETVAQLDIDCIRQYIQFEGEIDTYDLARARIAEYPTFFEFVNHPRFNGKKTFISQAVVKTQASIKNTCAHGLTFAELAMVYHEQNLANSEKVSGLCLFATHHLFDEPEFTKRAQYYYNQRIGELYSNTQTLISATPNDPDTASALIIQAIKDGPEIRIGVLNPTATAYEIDALQVNGTNETSFSVTQTYSADGTSMGTTATTVTESELNFRPYSFSVIKYNPTTMQGLFGVTINNSGLYYDDLYGNSAWNTFIESVKFKEAAFTAGAEDRWIRPVSKRGGFDLIPNNESLSTVTPRVGMGANSNEIYYYTQDSANATDLHETYNDTGNDFLEISKDYATAHSQKFIFTANISHGTTAELGTFLAELVAQGLDFKVRYGNEMSTGTSGVDPETTMTSAQYLTKITEFDDYMIANYPNVPRVINIANSTTVNWDNDALATEAKARHIEEFSQYLWLGDDGGTVPVDPATNVIDDYFTTALSNTRDSVATGNNSLYGEILPRIQTYYDQFYPVKMHVGQYGCSLQRTGYVANTMLHGLMIWNELFEFFKFNSSHDNFINSAVFLVNESAVDLKVAADNVFTIPASLTVVDGADTFVKRIQGVAYELLQPLSTYSTGYPRFVPVTITNQPSKMDAVAFVVGTEVYVYIYNILTSCSILTIDVDGTEISSTVDKTGAYSTELYGSVGTCPAYQYFKDYPVDNPTLVPTDVALVSVLGEASTTIAIPEHSIIKLKLNSITSAVSITLNF